MDNRGYQQYREQSMNTMTQGELLLMLYDELVKRAMRAELSLEKKDYPLMEQSIDRCIDIINYLDDTLDRSYPISRNLHQLYNYFGYQLNRAKIGRNVDVLKEVKLKLVDLRDTFRTAEKSSRDNMPHESLGEING